SWEERQRLIKLKNTIDKEGSYIGASSAILGVFERIAELNRLPDKPILILGETGVGKTEFARLIHAHSDRKAGKFINEHAADNKSADFSVLKSRWAGYGRRSGLPNADPNGQNGLLQEAAGGTIFIDEFGDLSDEFQGFLRAVLDGKEIPPAA